MGELVDQVIAFLDTVPDALDKQHILAIFNGISLSGVSKENFSDTMTASPALSRDLTFFATKYRKLFKLKEKELRDYKTTRLFELRQASEEGLIRDKVGFSLPQALIERYVENCEEAKTLESELITLEAISRMLTRLDYQSEPRTNVLVQLSVNRRALKQQKEVY